MNWIWTTNRHVDDEHVSSGNPMVDMLHGAQQHRILGYTDNAALLEVETGILAREITQKTHTGEEFKILIVSYSGEHVYGLADTLDEFAAKVGAPPRPKIEVPPAFLES